MPERCSARTIPSSCAPCSTTTWMRTCAATRRRPSGFAGRVSDVPAASAGGAAGDRAQRRGGHAEAAHEAAAEVGLVEESAVDRDLLQGPRRVQQREAGVPQPELADVFADRSAAIAAEG